MLEVFVDALWQHKEKERGWVLIWDALYQPSRLVNHKSTWCCATVEVVEAVSQVAASTPLKEIYIGAGLRGKKHGRTKRGGSKDVSGVAGLWVELDIKGPAHSEKNYPPDEQAVNKVLESTGLKPTILVNSGHGIQAWWLFTDCLYFDSDQERDEFQRLMSQWQKTLAFHAHELGGWAVDTTSDLARVMRIPGTVNHKLEDIPVQVQLIGEEGPRYDDCSEFEERLVDKSTFSVGGNHGGPIILDENANPMIEMLEGLKKASRKFRLSWDRKRTDFKDQSASAYCMSMACFAAEAGWTDQEIVDLLISWRRKENEPLKLRIDWYCDYSVDYSTIPKARRIVDRSMATEELTSDGSEKDTPDEVRAAVSKFFDSGVEILIQHGEENSRWSLEMVDGRNVELGTSAQLYNKDHCRGMLCEKDIDLPDGLKKIQWERVVKKMRKHMRRLENPEAGDRKVTIREWLDDYLQSTPAVYSSAAQEGWQPALNHRCPFVRHDQGHNGYVYIHAAHFREWLEQHHKEKIPLPSLHDMLRLYNFERKTVTVDPLTKSYWRYSLATFKFIDSMGVRSERSEDNYAH